MTQPCAVRFTISCPEHGDHDAWATLGTAWGDVIGAFAAPPADARPAPLRRRRRNSAGASPAAPAGPSPAAPAAPGARPSFASLAGGLGFTAPAAAPTPPGGPAPDDGPGSGGGRAAPAPESLRICAGAGHSWFCGAEPMLADSRAGRGAFLAGVSVTPRPEPPAGRIRGPWEWVILGSSASGTALPARPVPDEPATAERPPAAVRIARSGQVQVLPHAGARLWVGSPLTTPLRPHRRPRRATRVRWRRARRRWRTIRSHALLASDSCVWQLRPRPAPGLARDAGPGLGPGATPPPRPFWRPPPVRPDAEETPERAGGRGGKARDAIVPVGGAVAMAAAMAAMTRNPVFALLPLLGVFGYLSPRLARLRPMRSVIDVDAAAIAAAPPAPPAAAGHTGAAEPAGPPAGSARRLPDAARDPAGGLRLIPWDRVIAPGETVWVTGEPRAAAALARTWLLAEAAGRPPGFIEIHAAGPRPAWAWSRWFTPAAPALSVSVGQGAPNRRPRGSSSPAVDVVIAPSAPRGAADVVEVRATGLGLVAARLAGGPAALFLPPGAKLAEALARQAAGAALPPGGASDLTGVLPPEQTAARWAAGGLAVPIGVDRSGSPLALDLPRDGPHLLVAGATGSGKSEFLRSLILGCALSAGPDQLTIVGIDHKGGATFSGLDTLPHLAGLVTDLDAEGSRRAIVSLAAELTRRERLLERAGAQDFAALPPAERPPRILVVIDEFRALVESLPDAESRLERLAAQGRSLGMHLVLATQRPAGAVSAHLRANLALRICFRVAGDTDSMDVIDSSMAAHIDPRLPGTACLASAGRPTRSFRALLACGPAPAPPTARAWPDQWEAPPAGPVPAPDAIVRQIVQAAASLGLAPAQPPWRPPLPHAIALGELAGAHGGQAEGAPPAGEAARAAPLTIGLADSPETLNQFPLRVHPDHGNLLVIGAPRTGRTTAARTVAAAALARGWEVHAVTATPGAFADLTAHPCFGTLVGRDEPRRLARLLRVLRDNPASTGAAGPSGPPHPSVLIADDAEALASLPLAGFDDHPLEALGAARAERWPWLVATCLARHAAARWTGHFPARLVLPTIDRSEDVAAGVSSALAGGRVAPGRAVYLRPGVELLAHVATAHAAPAGGRRAPCPGPLRLAPVPTAVRVSELPAPRPGWAWAGLGGDTAQPVGVPLEPGRLVAVIGPPGSGKTALADLMAAQAVAAGARPERVDGDSANPWPVIESLLAAGKLVVADNLDRAPGCPPFLPATGTLVATMSTTGAAGFHGPGNLVRARPTAIVLWPETPGSSEAVGVRLAEGLDPRAPRRPGRGIVVNSQAIEPIQCPAPAPARTGPRFALRN